MNVTITSKLTAAQSARIRRRAAFYERTDNVLHTAFQRVGRGVYAPLHDQDAHSVARHMMTVAGATFRYEVGGDR